MFEFVTFFSRRRWENTALLLLSILFCRLSIFHSPKQFALHFEIEWCDHSHFHKILLDRHIHHKWTPSQNNLFKRVSWTIFNYDLDVSPLHIFMSIKSLQIIVILNSLYGTAYFSNLKFTNFNLLKFRKTKFVIDKFFMLLETIKSCITLDLQSLTSPLKLYQQIIVKMFVRSNFL